MSKTRNAVVKALDCHVKMREGKIITCEAELCPYYSYVDIGTSLCNTNQICKDSRDILKCVIDDKMKTEEGRIWVFTNI